MSNTKTLEENWKPTKEQLQDSLGRPLTQALFLEGSYSDFCIYTTKDWDYEYKGKIYPSIKRLYLEMEDPTEYEFANTYFLGWRHWQRICDNRSLMPLVQNMRDELELKLRARAVQEIKLQAKQGSFQATKWLADRGWDKKAVGRPSKDDVTREARMQAEIHSMYESDAARLKVVS